MLDNLTFVETQTLEGIKSETAPNGVLEKIERQKLKRDIKVRHAQEQKRRLE